MEDSGPVAEVGCLFTGCHARVQQRLLAPHEPVRGGTEAGGSGGRAGTGNEDCGLGGAGLLTRRVQLFLHVDLDAFGKYLCYLRRCACH